MDLVTIIVPVYNVEKYLRRCLDSIIKQTYTNLEIIVVHDGSPDNSLAICREYEALDDRIKVLDQPNGGLSNARNNGLKLSHGQYVAFFDSDDYLSLDALERSMEVFEEHPETQIVELAMVHDREGVLEHCGYQSDPCVNGKDLQEQPELLLKLAVNANTKIYRKELIEDLPFPEGLIHEDEYYTCILLSRLHYLWKMEGDYQYYYFMRSDSITHVMNNKIYQMIDIYELVNKYYHEHGLLEKYYQILEQKSARVLLITTLAKKMAFVSDKEQRKVEYRRIRRFIKKEYKTYKKNPYLTWKEKTLGGFLMQSYFNCLIFWIFMRMVGNKG